MKRLFSCAAALCLLYVLSASWAANFPLESLKPGMQGYALTAGPGNDIERFAVEVLGLQHDVGLGFPLVLVKATGAIIEASGGVAAGMSGSPVYLAHEGEDALLGAIGYVFPSSDHSLALVTPISAMRETPQAYVAPFGGEQFARYDVRLGDATPVTTPLLFSGLSERAGEQLESLFRKSPVALLPTQLGNAGSFDEEAYDLQPGSAVSVQLVRGDITIAAVGTVTTIEDDSLLAFGHPFLGEGKVSFALAPAFVSYIVPSDVVPFKLANNGQTLLGTIVQDRPAAIRGELDRAPDFLPLTLTLSGSQGTLTKRFEVTDDERYYAPLMGAATLQLFDETKRSVSAGTADLAWEITLQDGEVVRILEQISDPDDIVSASAALAAAPLGILAQNIFEVPNVRKVELTINYDSEQRYAEIVEVSTNNDSLEPGQSLTAHVRLQPYRTAPTVKTFTLRLPEEAEGSIEIIFRGGLEPGDTGGDGDNDDPILSFGELLVALNDQVQSSELVIETFVDGERVRLKRVSFPYLIQGEESLEISIDSPEDDSEEEEDPENLLPEDAPEPDEDFPEPGPPLEPTRNLL